MNLLPTGIRLILYLVAGASALAATKMPYSYYKPFRFVVFIASIGVSLVIWDRVKNLSLKMIASFYFIAFAIVFNPLIPLRLHRTMWMDCDIDAAIFFVLAAVLLPLPGDE
jgi:hypothetical protein